MSTARLTLQRAVGRLCQTPQDVAPHEPRCGGRTLRWHAALAGLIVLVGLRAVTWAEDTLVPRAGQGDRIESRDARPVALLSIPHLGVLRRAVDGAQESDGVLRARHVGGTALPGGDGNSVIDATPDPVLGLLAAMPLGTELVVETPDGSQRRFTVRYVLALDERDTWIAKQEGPNRLTVFARPPAGEPSAPATSRYVVSAYESARDPASAAPAQAAAAPARRPG